MTHAGRQLGIRKTRLQNPGGDVLWAIAEKLAARSIALARAHPVKLAACLGIASSSATVSIYTNWANRGHPIADMISPHQASRRPRCGLRAQTCGATL